MELGIYGEYLEYRRGYLAWRQGGTNGARGEIVGTNGNNHEEDELPGKRYPSLAVFKWRYTAAYWSSVLTVVGSILFAVNAACELTLGLKNKNKANWTVDGYWAMSVLPNLVGGKCFLLALYFAYLQLINVATEESVPFSLVRRQSWSEITRLTRLDSVVGTLVYLIGAIVFEVAVDARLFMHAEDDLKFWLFYVPLLVGSLLFLAGGVCECSHNRILSGGLSEPKWWISVLNTIGGLTFTLGSIPLVTSPHDESDAKELWSAGNYLIGAICFVIAGGLLLVMWKANDFGLALISRLNLAVDTSSGPVTMVMQPGRVGVQVHVDGQREMSAALRDDEARQSFTIRGVIFIFIYCWFVCAALLDCICKAVWYRHDGHSHVTREACDFIMQVFLVMLIILVLVIHSAVARVPRTQPYKCTMVCVRITFLLGAAVETIVLAQWMLNPEYDDAESSSLM